MRHFADENELLLETKQQILATLEVLAVPIIEKLGEHALKWVMMVIGVIVGAVYFLSYFPNWVIFATAAVIVFFWTIEAYDSTSIFLNERRKVNAMIDALMGDMTIEELLVFFEKMLGISKHMDVIKDGTTDR